MKLYSWNVNGIRSVLNKGSLQAFLASHSPDILCLQETKAQRDQVPFDVEGYTEVWNSASKKGYSGTAVFSKQKPLSTNFNLPADIAQKYDITTDAYGDPNDEGRIIAAEFDGFYVVTVYTPNAKDDLSRVPLRLKWDAAFLDYCERLRQKKPVVFCGDLNVAHTEDDLANPKSNKGKKGFTTEERGGFQNFVDAGYHDTFRLFTQGNGHYTWWNVITKARERNVGWRIDYVLVSPELRDSVISAQIHADVMGSDHCPVSVELRP